MRKNLFSWERRMFSGDVFEVFKTEWHWKGRLQETVPHIGDGKKLGD